MNANHSLSKFKNLKCIQVVYTIPCSVGGMVSFAIPSPRVCFKIEKCLIELSDSYCKEIFVIFHLFLARHNVTCSFKRAPPNAGLFSSIFNSFVCDSF